MAATTTGVKMLRVLAQSRDPSPRQDHADETGEPAWESRAATARDFVNGNPLLFGFPSNGGREVILEQLKRGDEHEGVRDKCWRHVQIELDGLQGWDLILSSAQLLKEKEENLTPSQASEPPPPIPEPIGTPTFPQSVPALDFSRDAVGSTPGPRSQSARSSVAPLLPAAEAAMEGSLSARGAGNDNCRDPNAAHTAASTPLSPKHSNNQAEQPAVSAKPTAKMTMIERQECWMRAKKAALEQQRVEKEEKENASLSFKPDTGLSKRTFRPSTLLPTTQRAQAAEAKAVEAINGARNAAAPKSASAPNKWQVVKAKIKGGAVKAPVKRKSVSRAKKANQTEAPKDELEVEKTEVEAGDDQQQESDSAEGTTEPEKAEEEKEKAPEQEPFVPGQFWWRVEEGRGSFRVNDGADFQMWTIYRKKDKSRDVAGNAPHLSEVGGKDNIAKAALSEPSSSCPVLTPHRYLDARWPR